MPRGRKPVPTALKVLHGNPGRRPLPTEEPRPAHDMPTPPAHLGEIALQEWDRVGGELHRIGVLTMVDRAVLAAYCRLYERWALAEQAAQDALLATSAKGNAMPSMYISVAHGALALMLKYMVELGLTPSSRTRIKAQKPGQKDELEAFLKQGKRSK